VPPRGGRPRAWHVYYGDVQVGTIARRVGIPHHGRQWGWNLRLLSGKRAGEFRDGTAATFDQARADTHERVPNGNLSFTDVFYPLNGGNVS